MPSSLPDPPSLCRRTRQIRRRHAIEPARSTVAVLELPERWICQPKRWIPPPHTLRWIRHPSPRILRLNLLLPPRTLCWIPLRPPCNLRWIRLPPPHTLRWIHLQLSHNLQWIRTPPVLNLRLPPPATVHPSTGSASRHRAPSTNIHTSTNNRCHPTSKHHCSIS